MLVTVAGLKGGVGRSTTAIHLACYLATRGAVALIDDDPNRTALIWSQRGPKLPFDVIDAKQGIDLESYEHLIIDSPMRPSQETLQEIARPGHYLVLPTTPDTFALDPLLPTLQAFRDLQAQHYSVLLTQCPSQDTQTMTAARQALSGFPLFTHVVRRFSAYEKSAILGVPVYAVKTLDSHAADAWSDYEQVGNELIWKLTH
jgi:chromosome partitioning protein